MKYDTEKSFGYPVLCQHNDDYVKSLFQVNFAFDINPENPNQFVVNYKFTCGVKEIRENISNKNADFWIKISCRSTFYSQMHEVDEIGDIAIDGNFLRDTIEISGYIIGSRDFNMESAKINPEFGFNNFEVHNGQVLALSPPRTYVTEKDFWKPISSIFEYRQSDDLKNGEFSVDIEEDFVQIFSNSVQFQSFKQFEKSSDGKIALVNTVFFSALCKMIDAMNEKPEDYIQKKWARVLEAKASSKNIDLKNPRAFVAAQQLLDRPLSKLAKAFLEK